MLLTRTTSLSVVRSMLRLIVGVATRIAPGITAGTIARYPAPERAQLLLAGEEVQPRLDEIPTETTSAERRFLYVLFSRLWAGSGDVVEIGPFFGGTTRAIAMGMLAHPARNPDSRLHTFDRFGDYYEGDRVAAMLQPLADSGRLSPRQMDEVRGTGDFGSVFELLHSDEAYFELVEVHKAALPDDPAERGSIVLPHDGSVSACFVDGAKSWYATKALFAELQSALDDGSWLVLQDLGAHSCFWLPPMVHLLGDALTPVCSVDFTYAYRVDAARLREADLDQYPDRPEDADGERLARAYRELGEQASKRGDYRGEVMLALQHAGALAYRGETSAARLAIDEARHLPGAGGFEGYVDYAAHTPTYRPDGTKVHL